MPCDHDDELLWRGGGRPSYSTWQLGGGARVRLDFGKRITALPLRVLLLRDRPPCGSSGGKPSPPLITLAGGCRRRRFVPARARERPRAFGLPTASSLFSRLPSRRPKGYPAFSSAPQFSRRPLGAGFAPVRCHRVLVSMLLARRYLRAYTAPSPPPCPGPRLFLGFLCPAAGGGGCSNVGLVWSLRVWRPQPVRPVRSRSERGGGGLFPLELGLPRGLCPRRVCPFPFLFLAGGQ